MSASEPRQFDDAQVRASWLEPGEPAPFRGVLLNDYTYYQLRQRLIDAEVTGQ